MRKYRISAMLLDLQRPFKVIGRLREPLLEPTVGGQRAMYRTSYEGLDWVTEIHIFIVLRASRAINELPIFLK
jgi:hypothetical protein